MKARSNGRALFTRAAAQKNKCCQKVIKSEFLKAFIDDPGKHIRLEIKMMSKKKRILAAVLVLVLVLGSLAACGGPKKERYMKTYIDAFDTAITFIAYSESEEDFNAAAEKLHEELLRYHKLYNIYNEYEGINNIYTINKNAGNGEPVVVDPAIIDMLEMAVEYYEKSDGEINVAMGSVLKIWHNTRTHGIAFPEDAKLPKMERLIEANAHTDISKMIIDRENSTVYLEDPEMALDVGAIAKGYATEMVALMLEEDGWVNAALNVGGNIRSLGVKGDGSLWAVGIQNPDLSDTENVSVELIEVERMSLATSGVYQRFYTVDGKNYHHIIDKDSLMPEDRYLSVSILTPHSGVADAVSTALFNMDIEEGKEFLKKLDDTYAMWILPDMTKMYSEGFEDFIVK